MYLTEICPRPRSVRQSSTTATRLLALCLYLSSWRGVSGCQDIKPLPRQRDLSVQTVHRFWQVGRLAGRSRT
ncbi:hypothetical protein F5X96DRAFT_641707 [Biscogniauxia mediterranea]|nr:hypothetical protein F5X96DRAFT_641707 [Biscogniauxia mediterranea]